MKTHILHDQTGQIMKLEMVAMHPDIRLQFQPNQTSASAGGYPLALAGIRADTRGYPPQK
jgi:hypothetical protein